MSIRSARRALSLAFLARVAALAALVGCSGTEPTIPDTPPGSPASIRFISGEVQNDTAMAMLNDAVAVEVRDSAGRLVQVAPVIFTVLDASTNATFCSDPSVASCILFQYADSTFAGRASARIRLGMVAGGVRIGVAVRGTTLSDSTTLTIRPAAPVRLTTVPSDSAAYVGNSYRVAGRVLDQYGNVRQANDPITFAGSGAAATMSADGVFRAQAIGRALAIVRSGSLVDTAWITVPPRGTIVALHAVAPNVGSIDKVGLDGSGLKALSPVSDTYSDKYPDWISPSQIAFEAGEDGTARIFVADTLGVTGRLTAPGTPTFMEGFAAVGPGGTVYFDAWGGIDYGTGLWKVAAPGAMPVRIGPNPPGNANAWQATPAPDGQRLAYIDVNRGGLSLLDIATGAMTPLNIAAETPRWSPVGDWILFGAGGTLHLVHPDGSGLLDVAGARPFDARADWSPDGRWLIARSASRLELIDLTTGMILPLGWAKAFTRPAFRHE